MKKKFLILVFVILISATYGLLVGVYRIFPFNLLQHTKDRIEEKYLEENLEVENQYSKIILEDLISVSPNNLDSLKTKLNTILFGTKTLPTNLPDLIFDIEDQFYSDLTKLDKIEQFEIIQKYGISSIGYIFHPKKPINRLLIYHQGHGGDFSLGKRTIDYFLERGFTVYAFSMPAVGKNSRPEIYLDKLGGFTLNDHEKFKYLENPLQYFISPVITMINYSIDKNFSDISMVGISGGGWTTTLAAAVDSRIKFSFPVAGTYPMFIRFHRPDKAYGDYEETYEKLVSEINYLDMYIMGSVGKSRKQLQILNRYDSCCFDGTDYQSYDKFIAAKSQEFNGGSFEVFSDTSHSEHKISELALSKIFETIQSIPNEN
jgi:hypothetical protein